MESKKNKKKDNFILLLKKKLNSLFHIKQHQEQNNLSSGCDAEDEMIEHFLEARDMKAAEIMVPRADVVAVTIDSNLDVLKEKFLSTGFLRLLVYRKDLDDIVGFIHLKDVFAQICSNDKNFKIDNIITKTIYTARSTRCFTLFEKMKEEDVEVAVILDEYGGIEGVISIERLVEKMLGTMPNVLDEETQALPAVRMLSENSCVVDARTPIQKLEEMFDDVEFLSEEEGEYETIGGFILSYLDRVPVKGEKFTHEGGLEVEIVDATSRTVKTVKVTRVKNLP
jgi:magnesium and cobalt transporter